MGHEQVHTYNFRGKIIGQEQVHTYNFRGKIISVPS
jgi:hypothetical protein